VIREAQLATLAALRFIRELTPLSLTHTHPKPTQTHPNPLKNTQKHSKPTQNPLKTTQNAFNNPFNILFSSKKRSNLAAFQPKHTPKHTQTHPTASTHRPSPLRPTQTHPGPLKTRKTTQNPLNSQFNSPFNSQNSSKLTTFQPKNIHKHTQTHPITSTHRRSPPRSTQVHSKPRKPTKNHAKPRKTRLTTSLTAHLTAKIAQN